MGIRSLPCTASGPYNSAARVACAGRWPVPQVVVITLLVFWGQPVHAFLVGLLLLGQAWMMAHFLRSVTERALWYSGFGVPLFVLGMLVSALALRAAGSSA
jgi:chlorophyll/bacteriochlorophyll a synthase